VKTDAPSAPKAAAASQPIEIDDDEDVSVPVTKSRRRGKIADESDEEEKEDAEDEDNEADDAKSDEDEGMASEKEDTDHTAAGSNAKESSEESDDDEKEEEEQKGEVNFKSLTQSLPPSPVKPRAWCAPVTNGTFASSNGGKIATGAKTYHVKVILPGDTGFAMNQGTKTARKFAVVLNMSTEDDLMILQGFADDATKYMANLKIGECYTLDLLAKAQPPGKPMCLETHKVYYKIAPNSKIRPYTCAEGKEDLEVKHAAMTVETLLSPIDHVSEVAANGFVNIAGVVMKAEAQVMKYSTGTKIVLADEFGCVNVLFFEGKPSLAPGATVIIIGARMWINPKTNAKELSVYPHSVVGTNVLKMNKRIMTNYQNEDYSRINNVSAIPVEAVRDMIEIKRDAAMLENDTDTVVGTVKLHLDGDQPSVHGTITFNGCNKCRKKIKPLEGETDAEGNQIYDHEDETHGSHRSVGYNTHFYFNSRWMEKNGFDTYQMQVDDRIGLAVFGVTAEALNDMESQEKAQVIQKAAAVMHTFNIAVAKNGEIVQMLLVE
jgi:hypothetical protein